MLLGSLVKNLPMMTYIKVGCAAVVLGGFLTGGLYIKTLRLERDKLQTSVDTAQAANEVQASTIKQLEAQRVKDAETVRQLMDDVDRINVKDQASRRAITNLEKKNANVRTYLALPVPLDLQRVLADESSDEDGGGTPGSSAPSSSAVQASHPSGSGNHSGTH